MKGQHRLSHITFQNGMLLVPREKRTLQEFLSLYHPKRDKLYEEIKPKQIAKNQVEIMELEIKLSTSKKTLKLEMAWYMCPDACQMLGYYFTVTQGTNGDACIPVSEIRNYKYQSHLNEEG